MTPTSIVITTTVLLLGAYDLFAAVFLPDGATISQFVRCKAFRYPFIPFTIGYICGHIFGFMG